MAARQHRRQLEKAIAHIRAGAPLRARPLLTSLARKAPDNALIWNLLGIVATSRSEWSDAIAAFTKACRLAPRDPDFHNNLGEAHRKLGDTEAALPHFRKALALAPDHVAAHTNLAAALNALGREDEAELHLHHALRRDPRHVEAMANMAVASLNRRRPDDARAWYRRAIAVDPRRPVLYEGLADACLADGKPDDALDALADGETHVDDARRFASRRITALERRGDTDAAIAMLREQLEADPDDPDLIACLMVLAPRMGCIETAIEHAEHALARDDLAVAQRRTLHFGLGRLHDTAGDAARAFAAYQQGNLLSTQRDDTPLRAKRFETYAQFFVSDNWRVLPRATNRSTMPIFIVGMPRSGTTLVEQTLAQHGNVEAAGELTLLDKARRDLEQETGAVYPSCLHATTTALIDKLADAYLAVLSEQANGASHVVDKMPENYSELGLARLLFPRARIVHCGRHPLDTCLSCFFQDFYAGHGYSTDLTALGTRYRLYRQMMGLWQQLPDMDIHAIDYETMVNDQETVVRRLLAYLDLPWDSRCLRFHDSNRPVATASYDQVRQPLYRHAVGRYRAYQPYLGPLIESLGDVLDQAAA